MKINNIKKLLVSGVIGLLFISCSDYLNTIPDNQVSIQDVFKRKASTEQYLANVYSYMRTEMGWSNESPWEGISDEVDVTYPDYVTALINQGSMTSGKGWFNYWGFYYKGIRSATYFIQHVDENQEMTPELKNQYKAEARYLRAWFYFCIYRQYGPVIVMPETLIAPDATLTDMSYPRNSIKETVDYIESELNETLAMNSLPTISPSSDKEYGRITSSTCKALKSRLLLYAASDFYNADANPDFANFQNQDGKKLFDYTNADKIQRWQKAADAAKAVIDVPGFALYTEKVSGVTDPFKSCQNLFQVDWNSEVIYARPAGLFWEIDNACAPRSVSGWSGWGVTQQFVDAFFTKNGLPIDKDPAYSETGFSTASGDNGNTQKNTYNMYVNREPRFYVAVTFNNSKWLSTNNQGTVQLYFGGNSGLTQTEKRNYSKTGYLARKFCSPSSDPSTNKSQEHAQIYFRLGEIYLNYVEALNEVSYSTNITEILKYINLIRDRAGIPKYGTEIGNIPVPTDQVTMRDAIRRERRVELALESHRYFDCKRWIISEKTDGGPFYGMNVNAASDNFHVRTLYETRVFEKKNYLWPIDVTEIFKDKYLVQNPYWDNN